MNAIASVNVAAIFIASPNLVQLRSAYSRRARMVITPPAYCSGVVVTFLEPHLEHFIRLPTSGTGVSGGSGTVAGVTSRSWQQSRQYTQSSLSSRARSASVTGEVMRSLPEPRADDLSNRASGH